MSTNNPGTIRPHNLSRTDPGLYPRLCGYQIAQITCIGIRAESALKYFAHDAEGLARALREILETAKTCQSVDREYTQL